MFKDYYAILDIALDSDSLTIKKAYRMMSIRWHPDKNPNTDTTQQMIDVNEAYAILSDSNKRHLYDIEYRKFKQKYSTHKSTYSGNNSQNNSYDYNVENKDLEDIINDANQQARKYVSQLLGLIRSDLKKAGSGAIENMKSLVLGYIILTIIVMFILACIS